MIFMREIKRSKLFCMCQLAFKGTALKGLAPTVGYCQNREKKTFPSGGAFETSSLQALLNNNSSQFLLVSFVS